MESLGINYHAILPETITASVAVLIMMIDATEAVIVSGRIA